MKGLYFWVGVNVNEHSIIKTKINNQIQCFEDENIEMRFVGVENIRNVKENIKWFLPGINNKTQYDMIHAFDSIDLKEYSFIYIRMPTPSAALVEMVKILRAKNTSIKILIEVPTYPIKGERKGLRVLADYYAAYEVTKLNKYVDRIVTFSKDELIWGIPTIQTVNCADMRSINARKSLNTTNTINVITVSSYDYWHGYDRFIMGLGKYYSSGFQNQIINYYVVGDGADIPKYKQLVEKYSLTEHVFFVGKHFGSELDQYYDVCDIALDSMGRHRSNIYYNSSLKGKEYCAKGLPIVSGVCTELDSYDDYPYYMRVPADDSPIDINSVICFYNDIYGNREKATVIDEIRTFALEHFDFRVGMKPIIDYILE